MESRNRSAAVAILALAFAAGGAAAADARQDSASVARGRYLVTVSGCNDCHTPGGMEKGPAVPEAPDTGLVGAPPTAATEPAPPLTGDWLELPALAAIGCVAG